MPDTPERFLCISSSEIGQDFLRQCAELGVRPTLLTIEKLRNADWPREAIEDIATIPEELSCEEILNTVSWMARGRRFDRVVALDESDQETAAHIREHMRLPGMNLSTATCYRDRLAMRTTANRMGFLVPEFCGIFNYDDLRAYMAHVSRPWLLRPRAEASALGIRRIEEPERLWRTLDELGDQQSRFLLEQFVPGDVFHVDSIVSDSRVVFSVASQRSGAAMQGREVDGVCSTRTVDRNSEEWRKLTDLNTRLAPALGMVRGITHATYIRAHADRRFYFLEISARVGGAFIAELVETATGINLWREWAKLEVAAVRNERYISPPARKDHAGSVLCLANATQPDTSSFDAPEIVHRVKKHDQAGLIVRSPRPARVRELLERYSIQFAEKFLAGMPTPAKPTA